MPIAFNVDSQVESKNKPICFVPHVINSCINFVAQGTIGPGTKLEDGKGTAASGASFPKKIIVGSFEISHSPCKSFRSQQCDENVPKTGRTWYQ